MDAFWIGGVKVNGVDSASAVGIGPKVMVGVRSHTKNSQGNGSIAGDFGLMPTLAGFMYDPDLVDTPALTYSGWPQPG